MNGSEVTPSSVAQRGQAFYDRHLKHLLEPSHRNEFVVINVETGDYHVAEDDVTASRRLLERNPNCGASFYGVRIGHRTAYRIG